jgi:hypothetical protein
MRLKYIYIGYKYKKPFQLSKIQNDSYKMYAY